jgi:3-dehydroquinate synthase
MKSIQQSFSVSFNFPVYFVRDLFDPANSLFLEVIQKAYSTLPVRLYFVIDEGVYDSNPDLIKKIEFYIQTNNSILSLASPPFIIPGGEQVKNNPRHVDKILEDVERYGIDRHSYIIAIGGGAVLDLVGYAAAIAHRGVRHIRIPTTVLSQNDSGVGVKNGINAFGKKNFIGTFCPPYAVLNDFSFLKTLHERDWRAGISEAIKVSLIKDADFFEFLIENVDKLVKRDMEAMEYLIFRCAELHMQHIASKDPFETGSSRPLDFGHWAAHKLEQITSYSIRHGEAVAIGIAIDSTYSYLSDMITRQEWQCIIRLIKGLGFELNTPELFLHLEEFDNPMCIIRGLEEFREHLGGKLTIMLLQKIGQGVEVNHLDKHLILKSINILKKLDNSEYRDID